MAKCKICGEPMPEGEEMFKFHGYSGPCPKPPLPKEPTQAVDDELSRLRAENERLREALEPFSEMAGELFARNFNAKDVVVRLRHRPFIDGEGRRELTFWHFVRARKALEGE